MLNLPITYKNEIPVMSSIDLAKICVGESKDAHSNFMKKAEKVLGGTVVNFYERETYNNNNTRTILLLPEREACLMAMSYSYKLQADVYDAWQRLKNAAPKPMSKLEMLAQMANEMVRIDQQAGEALSLVHQANESIDEVKSQIEGLADKLDGYKVADKVPKHLASAVRIRSLSPYYLSDKAIKEIFRANLSSKDFNVETSYGIQTCAHYSISEGLTLLDRINEERTQVSREFWTHPKVPFKFKWQVS